MKICNWVLMILILSVTTTVHAKNWTIELKIAPASLYFGEFSIEELDNEFKFVELLNCENNLYFSKDQCREVQENGLVFELIGDYNSDGFNEKWQVGVAENSDGKYFKILVISDVTTKKVIHVEKIVANYSFSAFKKTSSNAQWVQCTQCDHSVKAKFKNGFWIFPWTQW